MSNVICYDYKGNKIRGLTQWDMNRYIKITGVSVDVTPDIHFFNIYSKEAYVVQSVVVDSGIICRVPNVLLRTPDTIFACIFTEEDTGGITEGTTVCKIALPVSPKKKPANYIFDDDTEYINIVELKEYVDTLPKGDGDTIPSIGSITSSLYVDTVNCIGFDESHPTMIHAGGWKVLKQVSATDNVVMDTGVIFDNNSDEFKEISIPQNGWVFFATDEKAFIPNTIIMETDGNMMPVSCAVWRTGVKIDGVDGFTIEIGNTERVSGANITSGVITANTTANADMPETLDEDLFAGFLADTGDAKIGAKTGFIIGFKFNNGTSANIKHILGYYPNHYQGTAKHNGYPIDLLAEIMAGLEMDGNVLKLTGADDAVISSVVLTDNKTIKAVNDKLVGVGEDVSGKSYGSATAGDFAEVFNNYDENKAIGEYSHAEGNSTTSLGDDSHAEGLSTSSSGNHSHAEGCSTISSGASSHAEGDSTEASGIQAHAEGLNTTASGTNSHSEGENSIASGYGAHAEGQGTLASNYDSHSEGESTQATGYAAHAEGEKTKATGGRSHSEGVNSRATGYAAHAEGSSLAAGDYSHSEGYTEFVYGTDGVPESYTYDDETYLTGAQGSYSHCGGYRCASNGLYSTVTGNICRSIGTQSFAGGYNSVAYGFNSFAYGGSSQANGSGAVAIGSLCHADGDNSFAGCSMTNATGTYSFAYGAGCVASGQSANAFGGLCHAVGDASLACGSSAYANGDCSVSIGNATVASGDASTALGTGTIAESANQVVLGKYNVKDESSTYSIVVGNGTGTSNRSNSFAVGVDGVIKIGDMAYTNAVDSNIKTVKDALDYIIAHI